MRRSALLALSLIALTGCSLFQRSKRPPHAPPEEAQKFVFPTLTFQEGRTTLLGGDVATAIQLAMDDYLPLDRKPLKNATPMEDCLLRRDIYQVAVEPLPDGIILVGIYARTELCDPNDLSNDVGGLYAVDPKRGLIIAEQR
ncbi:hypothetical protein DRW03_28575 [Corallococcus sp. H22C18031201]|nr:hypothetical protein DRW03_28575 [Corallococcus sp. H22C18031201]